MSSSKTAGMSTKGVTVVLGAQWGDEGKGKLSDILSQEADVCARCQVNIKPSKWECIRICSRTYIIHYHKGNRPVIKHEENEAEVPSFRFETYC